MKYRMPVKLEGVIEFEDNMAVGTIDTDSYEFSSFHTVTLYGNDSDVVEMVIIDSEGNEHTAVEADANIVAGIRNAMPADIEWSIE